MQINIQQRNALAVSSELLDLSREMRRAQWTLEDVIRELRPISDLDGCKRELQRQQEAAAIITVRLTRLSVALREIAEIYEKTEESSKNGLDSAIGVYKRTTRMYF